MAGSEKAISALVQLQIPYLLFFKRVPRRRRRRFIRRISDVAEYWETRTQEPCHQHRHINASEPGVDPKPYGVARVQARYTCNFAIGTSNTFGSGVIQVEYPKREPRTNARGCG